MALKRKTMEKTIKSTIAPNPKEFTHWTDLSADPYGNIIKSRNGGSLEAINDLQVEALEQSQP